MCFDIVHLRRVGEFFVDYEVEFSWTCQEPTNDVGAIVALHGDVVKFSHRAVGFAVGSLPSEFDVGQRAKVTSEVPPTTASS